MMERKGLRKDFWLCKREKKRIKRIRAKESPIKDFQTDWLNLLNWFNQFKRMRELALISLIKLGKCWGNVIELPLNINNKSSNE